MLNPHVAHRPLLQGPGALGRGSILAALEEVLSAQARGQETDDVRHTLPRPRDGTTSQGQDRVGPSGELLPQVEATSQKRRRGTG